MKSPMKFRETYGLQISLLCLASIASLFFEGCFGEPGVYLRGSFYQAQLFGGITTAHMVALAGIANALVYALPSKMEAKCQVRSSLFVGLLNIAFAAIYAVVVTFAWFGSIADLSTMQSVWRVLLSIPSILYFPFLYFHSLFLLALSVPLLLELNEKTS